MGEMITLKTLRGRYAYARHSLEWLYVGLVKDLNRSNNPTHIFSDACDLVQMAICFLCEFIGKKLNDIYAVKNGEPITIKHATYLLVGRHIDRIRRNINRSRDIVFDLREQKRWFAFLHRFQLALFAIKFQGGYDTTRKIKQSIKNLSNYAEQR